MPKVESFDLDHTIVKAPYVRLAGTDRNGGAVIQKFDLRLMQPNEAAIATAALHSIEHLMATYFREELDGVIDVSPMGCRTGFYISIWGEHEVAEIAQALVNVLEKILASDKVIAATVTECGHWRDHSLKGAKGYCEEILEKGISLDPFNRDEVVYSNK